MKSEVLVKTEVVLKAGELESLFRSAETEASTSRISLTMENTGSEVGTGSEVRAVDGGILLRVDDIGSNVLTNVGTAG